MKPATFKILLLMPLLLCLQFASEVVAQSTGIEIPGGSFHSVLPEVVGEPHQVDTFLLDETAVTNRDFRQFLMKNPRWTPTEIPTLYAGNRYLKHWSSDADYGDEMKADLPVTRVSWYAANGYCGWKGGRLPTLNEWEYAAQLMDFNSSEEANMFSSELIGWYSAVDANQTKPVGSTGIVNRHGVKDLFGLVMEWVEDFKPPVADDLSLDCGTIGRMQGTNSMYGYAMSIRYITRMSFKATSSTGMLGFRCAYDASRKTGNRSGQSSAQMLKTPDNKSAQ
jgi:formylglycine-generating enzyme required for sulfatase activity